MTVVITIKINYIIYNNNNNNNNNNNAETAHISIRLLHLSCAWILLKYYHTNYFQYTSHTLFLMENMFGSSTLLL